MMNELELFGYIASVFVALSLMMKSIKRLRWWNLLGSGMFSLYGLLIGAYPVFILNGFIALVNIYYLMQLYNINDSFELYAVSSKDSIYLKRFLDFYADDIKHYYPNFDISKLNEEEVQAYFVLRDMQPVSLIVFKLEQKDKILIYIDYAIPAFRDLKNASFFYHQGPEDLNIPDICTFSIFPLVIDTEKYLLKIGFERSKEDPGKLIKSISYKK
ncbi:MAG: hypothetical protein KAI81_01485 [Candidatus Marinimicrobia bacterium]|nr:hypothetical protein [Candidatus Neomarinimicrobiota bacterium]